MAPVTPNHGIPLRSFAEFLKLSWISASRLLRNKIKHSGLSTAGSNVFLHQSGQKSVSAHAFGWKETSTSLSHGAFSTALNLLLFLLKIIVSLGCCPYGRKQTFKVQNILPSPVFGCDIYVSLFRFSDVDSFLPPHKTLLHLWQKEGVIGRHWSED